MADFSVSGIIEGDSSGFQDAVSQATGALQGFLEMASAVAAGEGIANLFGMVISGAVGAVGAMVNTAEEFQNWGAVINHVGSTTADMYSNLGDSAGKAGAKQAASLLEAQDALIKYHEKITEINDNIADVMKGTNIIQAQQNFTDRMASIAESYADKVADIQGRISDVYESEAERHADKVQSMNDALADMETNHGNKVADTKAKQQLQVDSAFSSLAKKQLQDKFDKENQIAEDSYRRDYEAKKAAEEKSIAESDAKGKAAADKRVAQLNDQLARENKLHDEQVAKLKKQEDEQIAKFESDNAKKLSSYKQELADEDRAWELSQAKRAASSGGGGGGGSSAGRLNLTRYVTETGDSMAKTANSAENLFGYMKAIESTTPFNLEDIEKSGQLFTLNNVDASKMLDTVQNLSGHFQKDLGQTSQAILMAMHGRMMDLKNTFNITSDAMDQALGKQKGFFDSGKASANDVLEAVSKLGETKFSDGITIESEKSTARIQAFHNQMVILTRDIMGISEETGKPIPGGLFDTLTHYMADLTKYLKENRAQIEEFIKGVLNGMIGFAKFMADHWSTIKVILEGLALLLAVVFAASVISAIVGIVTAIGSFVAAFAAAWAVTGSVASLIGLAIAAIGGPITLIAIAIVGLTFLIVTHFTQIKNFIGGAVTFIKDNFVELITMIGGPLIGSVVNMAVKFVENLRKGQDGFTALKNAVADTVRDIGDSLNKLIDFAKNALSYLNPFAKHSPSLIDQIRDGTAQIKRMYEEVGNLQINAPNLLGASQAQGTQQIYNSTTNSSPTINQTNSFNISGMANANNVASYLAFQLEHKGVV